MGLAPPTSPIKKRVALNKFRRLLSGKKRLCDLVESSLSLSTYIYIYYLFKLFMNFWMEITNYQ